MRLIYILFVSIIFSVQSLAITIMPEIRTTVQISKTDINRINCTQGKIQSIDYALGTGLTHKVDKNGKNAIVLFQQLDNGIDKQMINSKVNFFVSCNNEYYEIIFDPQNIEPASIKLSIDLIEAQAKKNINRFGKKTKEDVLIQIIKESREDKDNDQNIQHQKEIFIDEIKLTLIATKDIAGTNYKIKKFIITTSFDITLQEKMFLSPDLGTNIIAVSLDDYTLSDKKNWTTIHVITDKEVRYDR